MTAELKVQSRIIINRRNIFVELFSNA